MARTPITRATEASDRLKAHRNALAHRYTTRQKAEEIEAATAERFTEQFDVADRAQILIAAAAADAISLREVADRLSRLAFFGTEHEHSPNHCRPNHEIVDEARTKLFDARETIERMAEQLAERIITEAGR